MSIPVSAMPRDPFARPRPTEPVRRAPRPDPVGPAPPAPPPPRPWTVTLTVRLIVAGIVLGIVDGVATAVEELRYPDAAPLLAATAGWTVLATAVLAAFATGVRVGSAGIRLVLTVIGVGWLLTSIVHANPGAVHVAVDAGQAVLIVATLVAVYLPASTPWFAGAPHGRPATAVGTLGWQVLGVIIGLGAPGSVVGGFLFAWSVSDGCSSTSTEFACTTGGTLLLAVGPMVATIVAALVAVVGLALADVRPGVARRCSYGALTGWLVAGVAWWILANVV